MTHRTRTTLALLCAVLALGVVLAGQSIADRVAPDVPNGALTGKAVGTAGFAYLTGLRQFGAALLWNRLEPQMHEYYGGAGLGRMGFMLPSIKAIVTLDPQFVEAYYVAPEIIIDSGLEPGVSASVAKERLATGLDLAKEGVENNPKSGILLSSYAQLLMTRGGDLKTAYQYALAAVAPDVVWRYDEEQWDAYAVLRVVFEKSGRPDLVAQLQAVMDRISTDPNATKIPADPNEP